LATLIYTPAIRAHIAPSKGGIIDISEDLVSWTLILRENAPHTFTFKLQNSQRKYDGTFLPMDRISIGLKRINWLQCFTGYLNDSPIFQAWPGTLDLTATCTLKVPLFYYWDPNTKEGIALITKSLAKMKSPDQVVGDRGLSGLIVDSLTQVVKWPQKRIHIGQVPNTWLKIATKVGQQIEEDTAVYEKLGVGYTINGTSSDAAVNIPVGGNLNATQAKRASQIYSALIGPLKITDTPLQVMTFMCALVESGLKMYANSNNPESMKIDHDAVGSDHGSVGLYQQQVGGAPNSTADWGTTQELMDPVTSTKKFTDRLKSAVKGAQYNPQGLSDESQWGAYVQTVQGSAYPDRYQEQLGAAKAIVASAQKVTSTSGTGAAASTPFGTSDIGTSDVAESTGNQVAKVASNLIQTHAASKKWIIYVLGGDDPDHTDIGAVTKLDCSSLVDWVYYHSTGGKHLFASGGGRSNVGSILNTCQRLNRTIPVDLAAYVRGAVLIHGPNEHIGVSLGNGADHVAAHCPYPDPSKDVDISPIAGNGFTIGGLLPDVDYSGSATTQAAANQLKSIMKYSNVTVAPKDLSLVPDPSQTSAGVSDPTSGQVDPFQSLVNGIYFNGQNANTLGSLFGGPIMMMNTQPFLPWLQNLVASSMRSFCSAPNGDFIAWFPDYFGLWKTAAIMNIEPIELQNFAVYWSDQQIVTHQYVIGNIGESAFDPASGGLGWMNDTVTDLAALARGSSGVATMDYPEIFEVIYNDKSKGADSGFIQAFLQRFGARPHTDQMPNIAKGKAEFFYALYRFMQSWAGQFTATMPTTFMPEVFPGMLVRIPDYGFQAYVQGVQHQGVYGQGGGFTTQISICAPSTIGTKNNNTMLAWLPNAAASL
jgi:hypothetical protein